MAFHPMLGRKYYWAVCNGDGVYLCAIAPTRRQAIRRYLTTYGGTWPQEPWKKLSVRKIIITMADDKKARHRA